MEFVVNDETQVNDRGFILLNEGMQRERFDNNPVMIFSHDYRQVIGRWKDLRVENGKMYLTAEFDEEDPAAKLIKGKVERGFLRGASLGLRPINAEYRNNPATGEECMYVTAWEWMECSICAIPSNASALSVQIYNDDRQKVERENLSAYLDNVVKLSAAAITKQSINMSIVLSAKVYETLGLSANAEAEAVERAVQNLSERAAKAEKDLVALQAKQQATLRSEAESLVNAAIEAGKITADKKDKYIGLAMSDMAMAKDVLGDLPGKESFAGKIKPVGLAAIPADRQGWTAKDWMQKDMPGLMKLKAEAPETYSQLFNL